MNLTFKISPILANIKYELFIKETKKVEEKFVIIFRFL